MPEKMLYFQNPRQLSDLYCARENNLSKVEQALDVKLVTREDWLSIQGEDSAIEKTESFFELLKNGHRQGLDIGNSDFEHMLNAIVQGQGPEFQSVFEEPIVLKFKRCSVIPKTINQKKYLKCIQQHEVVLSIGPAGSGKTFLAVAAALQALMRNEVDRIILTRPAVEAGEALGFLPGDLKEKIQPYLRPLYDALYEMLGRDQTQKLLDKEIIEIAPLAYMRGRTLSSAFIILDEAQNTTPEQMMMCLTRLGNDSRIVVTGDITQIDLPSHKKSGLKQASEVLDKIEGIALFSFTGADVVRHRLVQNIIEAYEKHKNNSQC